MKYWWVNQNKTFAQEVRGGFLWSPKTNAIGARSQFYENMNLALPGDVVFYLVIHRLKR
jgi:putative restriction endonuclease